MRTRPKPTRGAASRTEPIGSLLALGIRTQIAWQLKKKRTKSSALAAKLALLPSSSSRAPASDALTGSLHNKRRPRRQTSDAGLGQLKCYQRREFRYTERVYTRRKLELPCVTAAAAAEATSILPDSSCKPICEDDGQNTVSGVEKNEESPPSPEPSPSSESAESAPSQESAPSSESGPSSDSPKAWRGPRSTRKKKTDAPPLPVSAAVAETIRTEDGNNGNERGAAAAATGGRPQRQRKARIFKDYEDTSTVEYDWHIHYPNAPCPEGYHLGMELGLVETISASEGGSLDMSDGAEANGNDSGFSLKMQTDAQKTRKARRLLVENSLFTAALYVPQRNDDAAPGRPLLPNAVSLSSMCPQTPDKLEESNGECVEEGRTPPTPSDTGGDKDSPRTASADSRSEGFPEDDSTKNADACGYTSKLDISQGLKAKLLNVKNKRPRPKVKRPEKVEVAMPAKIPKTPKRKTTKYADRPASGAFADNNANAAMHEQPLCGTASAEFVAPPAAGGQSRCGKRQRQDERARPSSEKAAESASAPTAEVPGIAIDNSKSMVMVNDGCTITIDLTITVPNGPASEQRAECRLSASLAELDHPGAPELVMEETTPELDLQQRSSLDVVQDRFIPIFGGVAAPDRSWTMEEPPSTPRGNTLAVLPACVPGFLNSPSFTARETFVGVGDRSDSDGEQPSPTPTRQKRSNLTQRTRRSLLPAVDAAAAVGTPSVPALGVHAANQLVVVGSCSSRGGPRPAAPFPAPLQARQNAASQEEFQLVVYAQKTKEMVVYQEMGPKVKYKPRVNLDTLTINAFERLMLQGGEVNDTDRADEDWVEARNLWSDRAHHFNYVMRQVQGDRAFSKWGGSVLDSVVGAFLTQNVSDFLSSNAFMALRAHFPPREDARAATAGAPTEEQSSLTEETTPSGCSKGAAADDICRSTACLAADRDHEPLESSEVLVNAARVDNGQQESNIAPPIAACIQATGSQAAMEVSTTHNSSMNTFSAKSQPEATNAVANSWVPGDRACRALVIDLGAVHVGPMELTSAVSAGVPLSDAPATAGDVCDLETPPVTETRSEVPWVARTVQGDADECGEKGDHNVKAAQRGKASYFKDHSTLEDKFGLSLKDPSTLTPDGTEKRLAAALRAILGKQRTGREEAPRGQRLPLETQNLKKKPRNQRYVDMNRFNTNIKLLTGEERAYYEFKVNYKLDSEQKVTWEALRADVVLKQDIGRDPFTADSVDWEAVRRVDVAEVANVIKERGMNNILGGRIKSLLDRMHRDQDGSLDLEWVRKLSPINAQNFLTSVRGLGLKSVECIRLLTLHHPSFPVDVNVGRIVVRLGWVPLEPLPEETQLHLLEMYPVQEQIQKYMWPRLCTLDQQTLYEFHYQLITFGKVFCTKSKPNCYACPMQSRCKHFESAYCSARPRLEGPKEPENYSEHPIVSRVARQTPLQERQSLQIWDESLKASGGTCTPIIEEPDSPEYHVQDIEDTPFTVNCTDGGTDFVDLLDGTLELEPSPSPSPRCDMYIELNEMPTENERKGFNVKIPVLESEVCIEDDAEEIIPLVAHAPCQELVLLRPELASSPAPQLKNVQRLRTIHYVYELPDHHPLIAKMDKRDPEDPCFYLLAIWNSDEVPEAMPKISDDDASNPFACCQSQEESVRGTLLVPCRTAMKGSFPLNGTYFQVNEVFADQASSIVPIDVPRILLWNLKRRFVYFGTSVTSIFKGMSQEEIQCCFKKGYVCVRALDQITRHPKLLAARLHQSGAKIVAAGAVGQRGRRAGKPKVAS